MTKSRKTAGRSFFSNLPLELRTSLRSQILVPHVAGANINDFRLAHDTASSSDGDSHLLPTQPLSPTSTVDDSSIIQNGGYSLVGIPGLPSESTLTDVAESSTTGQKRAVQAGLSSSSNGIGTGTGKKRKVIKNGKGKSRTPQDVMKKYNGHAWDCTGLVERYTDPSEIPSNLVKCTYYPFYQTVIIPRTNSDKNI